MIIIKIVQTWVILQPLVSDNLLTKKKSKIIRQGIGKYSQLFFLLSLQIFLQIFLIIFYKKCIKLKSNWI